MSGITNGDFTTTLDADELRALIAAADVVLIHRWLQSLRIPIGEVHLRSAVRKVEGLLAAVELEMARDARRRANGG